MRSPGLQRVDTPLVIWLLTTFCGVMYIITRECIHGQKQVLRFPFYGIAQIRVQRERQTSVHAKKETFEK